MVDVVAFLKSANGVGSVIYVGGSGISGTVNGVSGDSLFMR